LKHGSGPQTGGHLPSFEEAAPRWVVPYASGRKGRSLPRAGSLGCSSTRALQGDAARGSP
jgi:hypothetical protein